MLYDVFVIVVVFICFVLLHLLLVFYSFTVCCIVKSRRATFIEIETFNHKKKEAATITTTTNQEKSLLFAIRLSVYWIPLTGPSLDHQ